MDPTITGHGNLWVGFRLKCDAYYEYTANHPDTITAVLNLYKISRWKALNLAKSQCRLTAIDRSTQRRRWRDATAQYTIVDVQECPRDKLPMQMACDLFCAGKRFTYHWGKFFIAEVKYPEMVHAD